MVQSCCFGEGGSFSRQQNLKVVVRDAQGRVQHLRSKLINPKT